MSTIFISHSSKNNDEAERVAEWLRTQGHQSLFLDFDPADGIPAGRDWEQELYRQIQACRAVIPILSEHFAASRWCFAEVVQARALGKQIFPVRFGGERIRSVLSDTQAIDLGDDEAEGYARLGDGLRRAGIGEGFQWEDDRSPYPGFLAFEERDAAVYFGREREIGQAIDLLNIAKHHGGAHLALVLGASGSGKSSLVRAGVYPRLRRDEERWLPLDPFRPRSNPLREFSAVLAAAFGRAGRDRPWDEIHELLETGQGDGTTLHGILEDLRLSSGRQGASILVFVDQFEEVLGQPGNGSAQRFLEILRGSLALDKSPMVILATMRSDSLSQFQQDRVLKGIQFDSLSLAPMEDEAILRVIEEPARVGGVRLEPGLSQMLLDDTETGDALPLLAFTLRQFYSKYAEDWLLEKEEYIQLGRLQGAVRGAAEQIVERLPAKGEEMSALRKALLRLVRISDEGQYLRRPASWSDLPSLAHPVLEEFVEARLLVSRQEDLETESAGVEVAEGRRGTVEVAHEALFRNWYRLQAWLDEDREALLMRQRIDREARIWDQESRPRDNLWRGGRLERAEELHAEEEWTWARTAGRWDRLTTEFLAESRRVWDVELEEKRRREKTKTAALRIGGAALLIALAALVYAWYQNSALTKSQIELTLQKDQVSATLARVYWEQARSQRDEDPLLSIHLMAQAISRAGASPLSETLITDLGQEIDRLRLLDSLRSDARVLGARFIEDSRRILTWDEEGIVRLWDAEQWRREGLGGAPLRAFRMPLEGYGPPTLRGVDFNESRKRIVAWSETGVGRVWDAQTGDPVAVTFRLPDLSELGGMQFSKDGERVLAWSDDEINVYDTTTLRPLMEPLIHEAVLGARFDAAERRVLTWGMVGPVRLWDLATGSVQREFLQGSDRVTGAIFAHDESTILTWGLQRSIRRWIVATGEKDKDWKVLRTPGIVRDAILLPRSDYELATFSADGVARLWDMRTGEELEAAGGSALANARFSSDGSRLVSWSEGPTARLWKLDLGRHRGIELEQPQLSAAMLDATGDRVVTVGWKGMVNLWSAADGRRLPDLRIVDPPAGGASAPDGPGPCSGKPEYAGVILDSTGSRLVAWTRQGRVHLWRLEDRSCRELTGHTKQVEGARFDALEDRLLTWGRDGTVRIWDAHTGASLLDEPFQHSDDQWVMEAGLDSTETLLWTRTDLGLVTAWRLVDRRLIDPGIGQLAGYSVSDDGERIVTWTQRGESYLLDAATGEVIRDWPQEEGVRRVMKGAQYGYHDRILAWYDDHSAQLWIVGGEATPQLRQRKPIVGARLVDDERTVLTWSANEIQVWDGVTGVSQLTIEIANVLGARLDRSRERLFVWTANRTASVWDVPSRHPVWVADGRHGASGRARTSSRDLEIEVNPDATRLLMWSPLTDSAHLWSVPGDRDFPTDRFPLLATVLTGFEIDLVSQKLRPVDEARWLELSAEYREVASAHDATCQFPDQNLHLRTAGSGSEVGPVPARPEG